MLQRFARINFTGFGTLHTYISDLGGVHIYVFRSSETSCSQVVPVESVAAMTVGKCFSLLFFFFFQKTS